MINHTVKLTVPDATAEQFYDFMINPDDRRYSEWWPGEHIQYHLIKRGDENHLDDEVYFDECLGGKRRVSFFAVVKDVARPGRIVWQMKKAGIRLPAFLNFEMYDSTEGIRLKHEMTLGYPGPGRFLDPFIRLYYNTSFRAAFEEHCQSEWPKLAEYLKRLSNAR